MKSFILYLLVITTISLSAGFGRTAFASPTLSVNSTGNDVIILQQKLQDVGYAISIVDGEFGNETKAAVEKFQSDHNLSVTGIVNNATWRALKKIKSPKTSKLLPTDSNKKATLNLDEYNDTKLVPFGKTLISQSKADEVVRTAKKFIGVPYVFGGTTPSGFDCSGFLQYAFKENGILIPRLADEQYKLGKAVKTKELTAGDLVFFTTYEAGASHCGIYLGEGQFLHVSSSRGVRIDYLDNTYWAPRFYGAKKIVEV